jgi:hypothetical protein
MIALHCREHVKLGCPARAPSEAQWFAAASFQAKRLKVSPSHVIGGAKQRLVTLARARAWKALADDGFSHNGIGGVAGFDHTSVRFAILSLPRFEKLHVERTPAAKAEMDLPWNAPIRERRELADNQRAA